MADSAGHVRSGSEIYGSSETLRYTACSPMSILHHTLETVRIRPKSGQYALMYVSCVRCSVLNGW
jgi:hypothetical protein